ncbi:MAG TPA: ABC transporter permease, partial [Polyangiaceae bacterium]|nr:ABC transporter permease [Polyangiaceae bacterium]
MQFGFSRLVVRNFYRSPLRSSTTVMTIAIMLAAFIFPRALVEAQEEHIRQTPNNRVNVRSKAGWSRTLPLRYVDQIRELAGVRRAYGTRLPALRLPGQEKISFQSKAAEMEPFLAMIDELEAPEDQKQAFLADESGAFVSETLAKEQGWKLGDRVVFDSRVFPGKWELTIACLFRSLREGYGERTVWLHYSYFNRALPKDQQDQVNWIVAQSSEPNQVGRLAEAIDAHFDAAPNQTLSLPDRVAAQANLGNFSAILTALDVVSYLILAVVMSIVGNTLAMNVRERTHEYGVMRAIGFGAHQLGLLVLAEAALLGLLGAAIGVGLSYPLFEGLLSR